MDDGCLNLRIQMEEDKSSSYPFGEQPKIESLSAPNIFGQWRRVERENFGRSDNNPGSVKVDPPDKRPAIMTIGGSENPWSFAGGLDQINHEHLVTCEYSGKNAGGQDTFQISWIRIDKSDGSEMVMRGRLIVEDENTFVTYFNRVEGGDPSRGDPDDRYREWSRWERVPGPQP